MSTTTLSQEPHECDNVISVVEHITEVNNHRVQIEEYKWSPIEGLMFGWTCLDCGKERECFATVDEAKAEADLYHFEADANPDSWGD